MKNNNGQLCVLVIWLLYHVPQCVESQHVILEETTMIGCVRKAKNEGVDLNNVIFCPNEQRCYNKGQGKVDSRLEKGGGCICFHYPEEDIMEITLEKIQIQSCEWFLPGSCTSQLFDGSGRSVNLLEGAHLAIAMNKGVYVNVTFGPPKYSPKCFVLDISRKFKDHADCVDRKLQDEFEAKLEFNNVIIPFEMTESVEMPEAVVVELTDVEASFMTIWATLKSACLSQFELRGLSLFLNPCEEVLMTEW